MSTMLTGKCYFHSKFSRELRQALHMLLSQFLSTLNCALYWWYRCLHTHACAWPYMYMYVFSTYCFSMHSIERNTHTHAHTHTHTHTHTHARTHTCTHTHTHTHTLVLPGWHAKLGRHGRGPLPAAEAGWLPALGVPQRQAEAHLSAAVHQPRGQGSLRECSRWSLW